MSEPSKQPSSLDATFDTVIAKDGAFATFAELAGSHDVLGTRRATKVTGTIDGVAFAATLMPSGAGPHWLPLRAALCKAIGKDRAGQRIVVRLQERLS